jgi:phosphatidylglycerol---prolipoprotein diacylglyceryl transferase
MQFPVYIGFGAWRIHPHFLFEALGYALAFRLMRLKLKRDNLQLTQRIWIVLGGLIGAFLGAKLLVLAQHIDLLPRQAGQWLLLFLQGKTVVGALLGGLIGVEVTKARLGITQSTGDVFVYPLLSGIAVGRIGCFLTGLSDKTYGVATQFPWGVDFGDGIPRHPTQLYEVAFLALLGLCLYGYQQQSYQKNRLQNGRLFQLFLAAYLSFRFLVDFLKPDFHPLLGISVIQFACLLGLVYSLRQLVPNITLRL